MPKLRGQVRRVLRYMKQTPEISEKGIKYFANKLHELEEEPNETQRQLRMVYRGLKTNYNHPTNQPIMRNIRRLHKAMSVVQKS
jgi:esterase/lipase